MRRCLGMLSFLFGTPFLVSCSVLEAAPTRNTLDPPMSATVTWTDGARRRSLPIRAHAPVREESTPLPVIALSHGFGESEDSHESLARYWARHGYLVLAVRHPGSDAAALRRVGLRGAKQSEIVADRMADLRFVINRAIADGVEFPNRRINGDPGRVAVAGHSLGSTSALGLVGLSLKLAAEDQAMPQGPAVHAAIAMSPQIGRADPHLDPVEASQAPLSDEPGLHDRSWSTIDVPTMLLWGSRDGGIDPRINADPSVRRLIYERIRVDPVYRVIIEGAEHHAFTDTEPWYPAGPRDSRHMECIQVATTAFLDVQLRRDTRSIEHRVYEQGPDVASLCDIAMKETTLTTVPPDLVGEPYDFTRVADVLNDSLHKLGGGAALVLYRHGRLIYRKGFGHLAPDSRVPIASASKWISGGVIMGLVDRGVLSLDDTVGSYLPEAPHDKAHISIRQLFSHTHGWAERPFVHRDTGLSLREAVERILAEPLRHEPGTVLYYSGLGMQVAARIAEIATGESWEAIYQDTLARPLGLSQTDYQAFGATDNPNVAGSVRTSGDEFARFTAMVANDGVFAGRRVLSEKAVQTMLTVQSGDVRIVRHPWQPLAERDVVIAKSPYGVGCWLEELDPETDLAWRASSGGAFGTQAFVDRRRRVAGVLIATGRRMTRNKQGTSYNAAFDVYLDMRRILDAAIDKRPIPPMVGSGAKSQEKVRLLDGPVGRAQGAFRRLDEDTSHSLGPNEIPAGFDRLFESFDTDDDQELDEQEYLTGVEGVRGLRTWIRPTFPEAELGTRGRGSVEIRSSGELGDDRLEQIDTRLADTNYGIDLPVRASFPRQAGTYPLVILSHYAGGSRSSYGPLVRAWVERGFVVIQPAHPDSPERGGRRGTMARRAWEERTREIRWLLDAVPRLAEWIPQLEQRLDVRRIAVAGQYLGALAAELVAGLDFAGRGSLPDDRVDAILLLSPQGRGEGKDERSWSEMRLPMLVVTGSNDVSRRTSKPAEWRTDPFRLSPPSHKYLLWLEGLDGRYGGLTGLALTSGDPIVRDGILKGTGLFLEAYLKGDASAASSLEELRYVTER